MSGDPRKSPAVSEGGQAFAAQAIARRLIQALDVVQDRVGPVLEDRDPEDLHKLRVAARRSRTLLKTTGEHLPAKVTSRGRKDLRWLGTVTTPVRDLDVLLAGYAKRFSEDLQARLRAERLVAWNEMAAALRSERFERLCRKWRKALEQTEPAGPNLRTVADAILLAASEQFVEDARALSEASPPEVLHKLRKDGKHLRYLLEFFGDLYPPQSVKALLKPVRQALDALGQYQDLSAHSALLSRFEEARPFLDALAAEEPERRARAMAALAPFRRAGALDGYRELTGQGAEPAMRTLVLWRHAKSDWEDSTRADIDRPLAERGRKAAPAMAKWIAENWPPERVICSAARRTVETWGHLEPRLPGEVPVRFDARAYLADPEQLLSLIAETPPETQTLLLIGHNPGLEDLTADLAERVDGKFATAAVAVLQFAGEWRDLKPGAARLLTFRKPKRRKSAAGAVNA